jgi:hypothetical protein
MDEAHDDFDEPSYYCQHGKYIGSPGGPDYLCQWCEDGWTVAEVKHYYRERDLMRLQRDSGFYYNFLDIIRGGEMPAPHGTVRHVPPMIDDRWKWTTWLVNYVWKMTDDIHPDVIEWYVSEQDTALHPST